MRAAGKQIAKAAASGQLAFPAIVESGMRAEREPTELVRRAREYLSRGPANSADLIRAVCSLPGAPQVVADHMARAMFADLPEFRYSFDGRWSVVAETTPQVPAFETSLDALTFAVVDLETTGGSHWTQDRITEIGIVKVARGEISGVYETLVNPERPIPPVITRITNITDGMVANAPVFDTVAREVLREIEGCVFVAHNAAFDWRFLSHEFQRALGVRLLGRRLCTVKFARKILPQLSRRSLDHLARYYGVEIVNRHRAGGDALATARCLMRMLDEASSRGCHTWADLTSMLRSGGKRKQRRRSALPSAVQADHTA